MGGLAVLTGVRRRSSRVLMFHSFRDEDKANLDSICSDIARRFHPVSLADIVEAADGRKSLPDYAVTVTVDDAYRSYLDHGHAVFRRHRIPVTLFAVSDFSDGRLWLWPDQIQFALERTSSLSLRAELEPGRTIELDLSSPEKKLHAVHSLTEALKLAQDDKRLAFMSRVGILTGVEIPDSVPPNFAPMDWRDLRAVASEGVEVGCHTATHPILSKVTSRTKLEREIRGAKDILESRLGRPVRHFCYPNGRAIDIGPDAAALVRDAGFLSATTTTWGLNDVPFDPMAIRRLPFSSDTDVPYAAELLAGLHLPPNEILAAA